MMRKQKTFLNTNKNKQIEKNKTQLYYYMPTYIGTNYILEMALRILTIYITEFNNTESEFIINVESSFR